MENVKIATDSVAELSLAQFSERLASTEPVPGGGAASAVAASIGASLISMVAGLSTGKPKYADYEATLVRCLSVGKELAAEFLRLADRDAEAYAGVGAAYKLPKSTDEEKAARTAAIQEALKAAAQVPLSAIEHLVGVVEALPVVLEHGNRNLVSDVGVAADFAQAALRCAWLNVEVNLASLKDEEYKAQVRKTMEEQISAAEKVTEEVWTGTLEVIMPE